VSFLFWATVGRSLFSNLQTGPFRANPTLGIRENNFRWFGHFKKRGDSERESGCENECRKKKRERNLEEQMDK